MRDFWRAIKFAASDKKLMIIALTAVSVSTAFNIAVPLAFKNLFDLIELSAKSGSHIVLPSFWHSIIIYSVFWIGGDISGQANYYYSVLWYNKTREILSKKVYIHLESLSLNYFENNSVGKIKERIDKGVWELTDIIEDTLLDIVPQAVYIVIATIILFTVNKAFGIILLISVPIFILISLKFSSQLIKIQDNARDANEKLSGTMTESIINIKTIKSYATEDRHLNDFMAQLFKSIKFDVEYVIKRIFMNSFRLLEMDFAQIIIIGLGVYWTITGKITLGAFTLAWQYTNKSLQPLWYITRLVDNIQKRMRSVRRVFELLDTNPEIIDKENAKKLKIISGNIKFDHINFAYKDHRVLNNLSLEIPGGKVVAIVGKSGSGKTTLIKLLSRFYEVTSGSITIDGQNINDVKQKSLRDNMGVVLQDSILFNNSVAENIAYSRPSASFSEIKKVAEQANAEKFIAKLPQGYETIVGERGVKLSGGEQQRINIARAILKNPPILVLDEATSSLDSESEQLIQGALWKLINGKTTIIIAHRLSTVMKADIIVVMDKGKISEMGTHMDLVKQKGIYSKLFEIQSGGYIV